MSFKQENDLWQALQAEPDPWRRRLHLLEMAKLLIRKATADSAELSVCEAETLTDVFLEYQQAGEQIAVFFDLALPYLDPEYKGSSFEEQLEELRRVLADTAAQAKQVLQQNTQLQKEQQNLTAQIIQLEKLETDNGALEDNLTRLQQQYVELKPQQERLKRLAGQCEGLHTELTAFLTQSVPGVLALLKENHAIYQTHFNENTRLGEAFIQLTENFTELSAAAGYGNEIGTLIKEIVPKLERFDALLEKLIKLDCNSLQ